MADLFKKEEIEKLDVMFEGDSLRDASSSIRGFIFQDLVAIYHLIDENTEFICSEYLEDLDVFCKDKTVKFLQIKYYPKTSPNRKEIMTDLYYQFLRLELLKCDLNMVPMLSIYRKSIPVTASLEEMQGYMGAYSNVECIDEDEPAEWLRKNVYCKKEKAEQKAKLFQEKANDKSIQTFLSKYKTEHITQNISEYKMIVADKIDSFISDKGEFDDDEIRKQVIIGLACNYIQKRYEESKGKKKLNNFKCVRQEFVQYISDHIKTKSEESIIAYVVSVVYDRFSDIERNNEDMSDDHIKLLNCIVKNTITWIKDLVKDGDGQYRLINTVSYRHITKISQFKTNGVSSRYRIITEHRENINSFISYLWKFMLDLNQELLGKDYDENLDQLCPEFYIDESKKEYICMKFYGDSAESSVILPAIESGIPQERHDDIYSRMYNLKPRKWYMPGTYKGKFDYKYNVADVGDGTSVLDVGMDCFTIECMKCIKIDKGQWKSLEKCSECVFLEDCID